MTPLVECVPNFSEGRDARKVEQIAKAIGAIAPVLDVHLDSDHNRAVITFAGSPSQVVQASAAAAEQAAQLIDLRRHNGVHPRIGALDVLPFVPLRGIDLPGCIDLAVGAAEEIWKVTQIPAYLYGVAARTPLRFPLAAIRRPGVGPPDIGGPDLHPTAGAVACGARGFLIAYNVNLDSDNLDAARAIARLIRESSGGLPSLKALGLRLPQRGIVQVSMNVTDFDATPLHVAYDAVRREAQRLGLRVLESELVGLLPRKAWEASAHHDLRWRTDPSTAILEDRLSALNFE